MAYAQDRLSRAMTMPASAGPTNAVPFQITWLRASAEGRSSRPTKRGVMAERVGPSMAETAAISATAA